MIYPPHPCTSYSYPHSDQCLYLINVSFSVPWRQEFGQNLGSAGWVTNMMNTSAHQLKPKPVFRASKLNLQTDSDLFWEYQQCFPSLSSYKQIIDSQLSILKWVCLSEDCRIRIFLWPFRVLNRIVYFGPLYLTAHTYPCVLVWIRDAQIPLWVTIGLRHWCSCNSCVIIKCLFSYTMILWLYWINSNRITSLFSAVLLSGWLVCSIGHNWILDVEAVGMNRKLTRFVLITFMWIEHIKKSPQLYILSVKRKTGYTCSLFIQKFFYISPKLSKIT